MDDFLKPVKTTKKVQSNIEKFESLTLKDAQIPQKQNQNSKPNSSNLKRSVIELEPTTRTDISSKILKSQPDELIVQSARPAETKKHKQQNSTVFLEQAYLQNDAPSSLSDNAREVLRNQPSHEDLLAVLQYLKFGIDGRHEFNIHVTSPQAAQIINVLVTTTVPSIWSNLNQNELSEEEAQMKQILLMCFRSVAGIGALVVQIRQLSSSHRSEDTLHNTVSVLGNVLKGRKTVSVFLRDAQSLYRNEMTRRLFWQEITALLAGSRVLSTVAVALSELDSPEQLKLYSWLGSGVAYTGWLAKNVIAAAIALKATEQESWTLLSQLFKRGMGLGYRDLFVSEIYTTLLLGQRALWTPFHLLIQHLTAQEQKAVFDCILSDLVQRYLASTSEFAFVSSEDTESRKNIAGAAALVAGLIKNNEILEEQAIAWLAGDARGSRVVGVSVKRALIAVFGRSEEKLERILEKSLARFSDKLEIQHAPLLQQDATAQTILLAIGYLSRIDVNILKNHHISTLVMHSVSNHLASSIPRTRLLGMIVGTAVSRLVDKKDNTLNFDVEEMESTEVKTWLDLVSVQDELSNATHIHLLRSTDARMIPSASSHKPTVRSAKPKKSPQQTKIISIEEVDASSESDEDKLIPYQKPDSDSEDSEEDPTLINRNKPSAPVYITDLIQQLQMTDKPDIISMALKTGPGLIRRKIGFGSELSDNVQTLATTLINLQDGVSDPELEQLRLDSLIVCIVAKPQLIGPSLADVYFRGDFSLSQRIMLLTSIGLAARDLAGFKNPPSASPNETFPSKRLPAHLEPQPKNQLSSTANPVAMLTDKAAHSTIRPMALAAADQATGPSALKIRTFSSRMEIEKRNEQKAASRAKTIPKNLHSLLTESIFLPLCSRMSLLLSHAARSHVPNTTILHSSTLRLFLQTLTLVLHTLGPSASLHWATLSRETLMLLTQLHDMARLAQDAAVLPALLHLLLALLEVTIEAGVTAQERLITDFGAQVAELVGWSSRLGDSVGVPDAEGGKGGVAWTVLAAGIQVKWVEMGKRFQGRMLGLTVDEMDRIAAST